MKVQKTIPQQIKVFIGWSAFYISLNKPRFPLFNPSLFFPVFRFLCVFWDVLAILLQTYKYLYDRYWYRYTSSHAKGPKLGTSKLLVCRPSFRDATQSCPILQLFVSWKHHYPNERQTRSYEKGHFNLAGSRYFDVSTAQTQNAERQSGNSGIGMKCSVFERYQMYSQYYLVQYLSH